MWYRSASFILDQQQNDGVAKPESRLLSPTAPPLSMTETPQQIAKISAHYQTRAAHHVLVTSDWLAQASAAVCRQADDAVLDHSLSL